MHEDLRLTRRIRADVCSSRHGALGLCRVLTEVARVDLTPRLSSIWTKAGRTLGGSVGAPLWGDKRGFTFRLRVRGEDARFR